MNKRLQQIATIVAIKDSIISSAISGNYENVQLFIEQLIKEEERLHETDNPDKWYVDDYAFDTFEDAKTFASLVADAAWEGKYVYKAGKSCGAMTPYDFEEQE